MKILITGGAGFIGSNLSNTLVELGHEVMVIDSLKNGNEKHLNSRVSFIKADLTSYDLSENLEFNPDYIYHLICTGLVESMLYPKMDLAVNGTTILNVLGFAEKTKASVLYTSTGAVHGKVNRDELPLHENSKMDPNNFYGASKLLAEHYCKIYSLEKKIPTLIFRLWNVFGYPQQINYDIGWIPVVTAFMTLEKPEIFGTGDQTRDFTYVKDVVNGLIKGLEYLKDNPFPTQIINLCGGSETSINQLYEKCSEIAGRKYIPENKAPSKGDVPFLLATSSKAQKLLSWNAQSIDEALKDYYSVLKLNNLINND